VVVPFESTAALQDVQNQVACIHGQEERVVASTRGFAISPVAPLAGLRNHTMFVHRQNSLFGPVLSFLFEVA
jgi:hypothetical protein